MITYDVHDKETRGEDVHVALTQLTLEGLYTSCEQYIHVCHLKQRAEADEEEEACVTLHLYGTFWKETIQLQMIQSRHHPSVYL